MASNDLTFSVDSQLLGELGERLVTHNYIALAELIKNAYDADATNLTIRFINSKKGSGTLDNSEIQLIDNGHGMTFEEVKDFWMRVATSSKLRNPKSPIYKRFKTGNKGLGRFACRKLAKKLIIDTTAKIEGSSKYHHTQVIFNWKDFKPGTTLTEIPCMSTSYYSDNEKVGTTLRLIELSEYWSDNEFNLMRRQVLSLSVLSETLREGNIEDPGFKIIFDAPEFPEGEGDLAEQVIDAGWGTLDGFIDSKGKVNLSLNAKNIGFKKIELPNDYPLLAGIQYKIAWIPIDKETYRNPRLLTQGKAQKIMNEQGGIRVYLNGFRVYPYGEVQNDWLEIDKDVARRLGTVDPIFKSISSELGIDSSRAMLYHPRNNNLIGIIKISSDVTKSFDIKLDREGFVENEAYSNLRETIRLSLQWMVLHYIQYRTFLLDKELKESRDEFKNKSQAIKNESKFLHGYNKEFAIDSKPTVENALKVVQLEVEKASSQSQLPEKDKKESDELVKSALKVIEQSYNQSEMYRNILGAVASTGVLMFVFTHEIKGLIAKLDTHAKTINRLSNDLPKEQRQEFIKFSESLSQTRKRFDQHIKIFSLMAQKTADVKRKQISLRDATIEVVDSFDYLIEYYDLNKPIVDIPENLMTRPMLDAEVYSILVNLISNAVKAVLAGNGHSILVEAYQKNNSTIIRVYDDGIGLSPEYYETVFQPLSADPQGTLYKKLATKIADEDLAALGRGTGLGLNIVKSMIEPYNGDVHFIDAKKPWKTCIEVIIP